MGIGILFGAIILIGVAAGLLLSVKQAMLKDAPPTK